jgi:hypothetical protein
MLSGRRQLSVSRSIQNELKSVYGHLPVSASMGGDIQINVALVKAFFVRCI